MSNEGKKGTSKKAIGAIGSGIGVVAIFVLVFAPIVTVSFQEPYKVMETRQEAYVEVEKRTEAYTDVQTKREAYTDVQTKREAYTDVESQQEEYVVRETRTQSLGGLDDYTLGPGQMTYWAAQVTEGARVTYSFSSNPSMDFYVVTESGIDGYPDRASIRENAVAMSEDVTTAKNGFTAIFDRYYFVVHNGHAGFWVLDKDVAIYSAEATATWEEDVTKYRMVDVPVTKYRNVDTPVTMYRNVDTPVTMYHDVDVPVTKYKDVQVEVTKEREATKNITLLETLMGKK